MFVRHVPGKCPLPESSRRPGANRAAKPLIDLALISGRVTRATRGIGAQSRLACEAEHILVFRAANVMRAHRQRIKILPAESSLDLTDWRTAPLGSSHRQCAINAARPEYHSAGWLTMGSRPLMHRGRGHRRVGRPKMSVGGGSWPTGRGVAARTSGPPPVCSPRGWRGPRSPWHAPAMVCRSRSPAAPGVVRATAGRSSWRSASGSSPARSGAAPTTTSRWSPASPAASGAGWSNGT